ncbi:MAG: type VI secretion system tube protein Hcp [Rhodospirillales bacterium]|nr:type VI secretion system tube protein Hcp [Rhodospirillales bacterium]
MADDDKDILMSVTLKGASQALMGASWSMINFSDPMMKGFFAPGGPKTPDNTLCSEILDFKFGVGIADDDRSGSSEHSGAGGGSSDNTVHKPRGSGSSTGGKSGTMTGETSHRRGVKFQDFMNFGFKATNPDGTLNYDVSLDEITVERQIDETSTTILKECLERRPLDSIVIVRRKFTGNQEYREAFIRLEFKDCLVTSIDWDNDENIKETMKFVYRELHIFYKGQDDTGKLDQAVDVKFAYES